MSPVIALKYFLRLLVGGGPTATHFFCFAKKSKQKKATPAFSETPENLLQNGKEKQLACGVKAFGTRETSTAGEVRSAGEEQCSSKPLLHLKQFFFLIHFEANSPAEKKGEFKSNFKNNPNVKSCYVTANTVGFVVGVVFEVVFEVGFAVVFEFPI